MFLGTPDWIWCIKWILGLFLAGLLINTLRRLEPFGHLHGRDDRHGVTGGKLPLGRC